MSDCARIRDRIDDYVARRIPPAELQEIDRHLGTCEECRRDVAAAEALAPLVARMPRAIEPPADAWPAIHARLRPRTRPARRVATRLAVGLAIAASLLVAAVVGVRRMESGAAARVPLAAAPATGTATPRAPAPGERTYAEASAAASADLRTSGSEPSPAGAAIARHLAEVDRAIAESEAALAREPTDPDLAALLRAAYRQKLDLLLAATPPPRS
jgi:hypothetical protein